MADRDETGASAFASYPEGIRKAAAGNSAGVRTVE